VRWELGRVILKDGWRNMSTIKLYGFWRSIASFRVRAALKLKGIAFEEIPVDILTGAQFSSDYSAIGAGHAVPAFVHDGVTLLQSLPIIEYIEEIQPEPPLMPGSAKERAYARALALVTVADAHPLMVPRVRKYVSETFKPDAAAVDAWARHWTVEGLATYERLLTKRPPSPYAVGATPGIADICIAGHVVGAQFFKADMTAFPTVSALSARCFALPAFAESHPVKQSGAPAAI
jgi:maleylacetoacetate isomerase